MPLPTDYDYIDYANATGVVRRLPVAKGAICSARPDPATLTQTQINSLLTALPAAPVGWSWQRKNCVLADGSWSIDADSGVSFTPDQPAATSTQSTVGVPTYYTTNQL